jgi:diphosphomevalonate decarboxylase
MGAGIASSASAFAALSLAGTAAAGLTLSEQELTILARLGSGSASRSIPSGFVEWHKGNSHETSYAETFAPRDYWSLVDVIAIISQAHKAVTSQRGHRTAASSDLQVARVARAEERFALCRQAVLDRDFAAFAEVVEMDSNLMHAVMMTSRPPLFYWEPASLVVIDAVRRWRAEGLNVCYTMDAGPNVHCLCLQDDAVVVVERLAKIDGVGTVRSAVVGGGASLVTG